MRLIACHAQRRGQAIIASVLTGMVLLFNAMAVSPGLHALLHADANSVQHQCAVTLFAHGQVNSTTGDVPMVAPLTPVPAAPPVEFSVFCPVIGHLPAGRAPPVPSSHS